VDIRPSPKMDVLVYVYSLVCFMLLCFAKELSSTDDVQVGDNSPDSDAEDATVNAVSYESETTADATIAADYMPVKRIVSDKEQLKHQALLQNESSPSPAVPVKTVPSAVYSIPLHLTAYAYDLGDISLFPTPKKDDTNKLGWLAADCWGSVAPPISVNSSHWLTQHPSIQSIVMLRVQEFLCPHLK